MVRGLEPCVELCADNPEPSDSVSPSLSLSAPSPLTFCLSVSLSNKHKNILNNLNTEQTGDECLTLSTRCLNRQLIQSKNINHVAGLETQSVGGVNRSLFNSLRGSVG